MLRCDVMKIVCVCESVCSLIEKQKKKRRRSSGEAASLGSHLSLYNNPRVFEVFIDTWSYCGSLASFVAIVERVDLA